MLNFGCLMFVGAKGSVQQSIQHLEFFLTTNTFSSKGSSSRKCNNMEVQGSGSKRTQGARPWLGAAGRREENGMGIQRVRPTRGSGGHGEQGSAWMRKGSAMVVTSHGGSTTEGR